MIASIPNWLLGMLGLGLIGFAVLVVAFAEWLEARRVRR
jgi:hypothetical protein